MTEQYKQRFEKGLEYQDFVNTMLCRLGWPNVQFTSEKYQKQIGESYLGVEIKLHTRMPEFKELYIEVAEKSNAQNAAYVPSGIMRQDNTIFWIEGDFSTFYVLLKKDLVRIYESKEYLAPEFGGQDISTTGTSIGYALPLKEAERIKVFKVVIEGKIPRIER